MGDLDKFIKEADAKSSFIKFEDGVEVVGIYEGAKVVQDNFNKDEQTVEYTLEVDEVKKTFNSKSVKLARLLNKVGKGNLVKVVRTGTGFDTKWYVKTEEDEDES